MRNSPAEKESYKAKTAVNDSGEKDKNLRVTRRFLTMLTIILVAGLAGIGIIFNSLYSDYKQNISLENANHLIEVNHQFQLYLSEKLDNDLAAARSAANSINSMGKEDSVDALKFMQTECGIRDVFDMFVCNADGWCVNASGDAASADVAQKIFDKSNGAAEHISISNSLLIYTVPTDTQLEIGGKPIVAVSVVQDLDSFIDRMDLSSFDGDAYLFITRQDGGVVSSMTHAGTQGVDSVAALLENKEIECLTAEGDAHSLLLASFEPEAFLIDEHGVDNYVVSSPISALGLTLRAFFFVPADSVNRTADIFAARFTLLSVVLIAMLALIELVAFSVTYEMRKSEFGISLAQRDRMFNLLVNNTNNAFALLSTNNSEPLYASSNIESIVGTPRFVLTEKNGSYSLVTDGEMPASLKRINEGLKGWDGTTEYISEYMPFVSGGRFYSLHISPIGDSPTEFIGFIQDATRIREHEEALSAALSIADRFSEAKSKFLANMSHDIRTPMNAIVNLTDFALESAGQPEKQLEYLNTIKESSHRLLSLINDVLDMSRIDSGGEAIANAPFDIKETLDSAAAMLTPLFAKKNQTFTCDIGVKGRVIGDSGKLSRVLTNIIGNASKFTDAGGSISFSAKELPSLRADTCAVRFAVEDNGIGISKTDLPRIFDPFMRAEAIRAKGIEGTGLGLPICKSYVSAMDGTITCESTLGEGSRFTVEIPFKRAASETDKRGLPPSEHLGAPFAGKKALLCEDNAVNRAIAVRILEKFGFSVDTADNGAKGVEMFTSAAADVYDIIYMDIRMPVMDGYTATAEIRGSAHPRAKTIPIIAMTANVFSEDIEKSRSVGMNGHLGKPIILNELVDETAAALKEEIEKKR